MADAEYKRLCSMGTCGGKHKAQGYCLRHYRQWQRGEARQNAITCAHCGAALPYGTQVDRMYCSKRCKHAAWVKANPAHYKALPSNQRRASAYYAGYCEGCGKAFGSRRKRMYCSAACEPKPVYVSIAPATRMCACCGVEFKTLPFKTRPSDFCSVQCKLKQKRALRCVHKGRREAVQRGANSESVNPFKVFDRDGWRCQLCGVKTPKAKRGTYEPNAPELDHIIPMSRGGEHTYRNTQCACRKCNGEKSDRPLGQLLLIG